MKPCSYCGRENEDEAVFCGECGTEIKVETTPNTTRPPSCAFEWLRYTMRCAGVFFLIGGLYLVSLGPVVHYFVTYTRSPPVSLRRSTLHSVGLSGRNDRGLGSLYDAYLRWWEPDW
jgi:hypothetical protein